MQIPERNIRMYIRKSMKPETKISLMNGKRFDDRFRCDVSFFKRNECSLIPLKEVIK